MRIAEQLQTMSLRRYVFFRDTNGRPYKGSEPKYAPHCLLSELGKSSVLQPNGGVGWQGPSIAHDSLLTYFAIVQPNDSELNQHDADGIIWRAFGDVAKLAIGKPLDAQAVLKAANVRAAEFFRTPSQKYFLISSLSVKSLPVQRLKVNTSTITPLKERGQFFPLPKILQEGDHRARFENHLSSTRYQLIRVACEGRSQVEALDRALDDINLLRALWSFSATFKRFIRRFGSGQRRPIGVIHLGPIKTLHDRNGNVVSDDYYWYDPDYIEDQELFRDIEYWPRLEKHRRWALKRISKLPYGTDLAALFRRYIAALDQPNPDVAFLQLWGILERLTDTVGGRYDDTISRTLWLYHTDDRSYVREMLEGLRLYRNRYVHSGHAGHNAEETARLVKSIVDPHFVRLLNNSFKVQTLREYGEFLSLPSDVGALKRMNARSMKALRVLSNSNGSK